MTDLDPDGERAVDLEPEILAPEQQPEGADEDAATFARCTRRDFE